MGGAASFSVIAAGTGSLTYQWQRNNTEIPTATSSTLYLENLTVGDFATYKVIVTNGVGSVTSNEAQLLLDSDEDGLPDGWETTHFGNLTAQYSGGDADADGVSNAEEYRDGTLPNSAASRYFRLTIQGMDVVSAPVLPRYPPGTVVTLTAQHYGRAEFTGWAGAATGLTNPIQVTMTGDKTVRALRTALPLDSRFAPLFTTSDLTISAQVTAMVRQPDGKILIGGAFDAVNGYPVRTVARLNADYTVDTTFRGASFKRPRSVAALALQSDGKIVIAGNGQTVGEMVRLFPDGTLDTTFSSAANSIYSMAVQPDDRILIGGWFTSIGGTTRLRVARLMPNGALDPTFDTSVGPNREVNSVSWQGAGKILIGGNFWQVGATVRNAMARLTDTGALDPTFNLGPGPNNAVYLIRPDSAGRLLVEGGFSQFNGNPTPALVRLFADGTQDLTFSVARANWNIEVLGREIIEQPDGKIIVSEGYAEMPNPPYEYRKGAMRFSSTGEWDDTFSVEVRGGEAMCMLREANGDLHLGGEFDSINGVPQINLGVYTAAHQVPVTQPPPSASLASPARFVPYADGRLLAFGDFQLVNGFPRRGVARLLPDGSVDAAFDPGSISTRYNSLRAAAFQPDGKILLGGAFYVGSTSRSMVRLNPDGTLDASFTRTEAIGPRSVLDIAVEANGRILVGGDDFPSTPPKYLARLEGDGSLDASFTTVTNNRVYSVAVTSDGHILMGGSFSTVNGVTRRHVARLDAMGQLDNGFTTGPEPSGSIYDVRELAGGTVGIAGDFQYTNFARWNYALLNPSGALDPARNVGGIFAHVPGIVIPRVNQIVDRREGGTWVGGYFTKVDDVPHSYLALLDHRSARDTTSIGDLQPPGGEVLGLQEMPNGDLIASGLFTDVGGTTRLGMARYVTTNQITIGAVAVAPSGTVFPTGSTLQLSVPVTSVSSLAWVQFEFSTDGENFTPTTTGVPAGSDTWQTTATLTAPGTFYLRATATDVWGNRRTSYIQGPFQSGTTPTITSAALATGLVHQPFSYLATVTGGAVTDFTATNLPAWATFAFRPATDDALLSGTPDVVGQSSVGLLASTSSGDANGSVAVQIFDTYENWKATQFTLAEQADPLLSGPEADFDHDGLSNRMEFALRSAPKVADLAAVPQVAIQTYGENQYLTLTYRRYQWAGQTSFEVEVSGSLSAWNGGGAYVTEVSRTDNGDETETVVVRDNAPVSDATPRFMRLRVGP